jgi:hypothetical protein
MPFKKKDQKLKSPFGEINLEYSLFKSFESSNKTTTASSTSNTASLTIDIDVVLPVDG